MPVLSNNWKFGTKFFFTETEVTSSTEYSGSPTCSPKSPKTPKSAPRALAPLKKTKNILLSEDGPRTSNVKSPVCRNLFQTPKTTESREELKSFLSDSIKSLSNIQLRDAEQKYNFNFRDFKPVECDKLTHQLYTWSQVSQDDYIPEFYFSRENSELPKLRDVKNIDSATENQEQNLPEVSLIWNVSGLSACASNSPRTSQVVGYKIGQKKSSMTRNDGIRQNDVTKNKKRQGRSNRRLRASEYPSRRQSQITDFLPTVCKKPKMLSGKKL